MIRPSFARLLVITLVSFLLFGSQSLSQNGLAFPLDDAWIHQGYARNLAQNGEWTFLAGQPSAGGTSFLWVLLLALGYLAGIPPVIWTLILSTLLLLGAALVASQLAATLVPESQPARWLIPLTLLLEWHLLWAAYSGMETLLLAFLALLLLLRLAQMEAREDASLRAWLLNGLVLGAAITTRPDGITLLGPLIFSLALTRRPAPHKLRNAMGLILLPLLIYAPFAALNLQNSGSIFPTTFFAKQAEYSVLLEQGLLTRWGQMGMPLIVGVGILLIPGCFYLAWSLGREKRFTAALFVVWVLGYITLYTLRLPLAYQHGRYMFPVIPVFLVLGTLGSFKLLGQVTAKRLAFILPNAFMGATLAVLLAFYYLGAQALGQDVAFIESQMHATADWVKANLPKDSKIAAHDIGALGYFAEPELYDLAGLVSPEVIPFIRDERQLADYLDQQKIDYLITFPDWYPELSTQGELLYQAPYYFLEATSSGGMAVIAWPE